MIQPEEGLIIGRCNGFQPGRGGMAWAIAFPSRAMALIAAAWGIAGGDTVEQCLQMAEGMAGDVDRTRSVMMAQPPQTAIGSEASPAPALPRQALGCTASRTRHTYYSVTRITGRLQWYFHEKPAERL